MPSVFPFHPQALSAEERCQKATAPDTKAPFAEGDFFVNNYEGATVLHRLKVLQQTDEVLLEAELGYIDQRFPPGYRYHAFRWRDQLRLAKFAGHWQVKEIHFKDRPSLCAMLKEYQGELKQCAIGLGCGEVLAKVVSGRA